MYYSSEALSLNCEMKDGGHGPENQPKDLDLYTV